MLLILIPVAWLVVIVFFVAICRAAARGDSMPAPIPEPSSRPGIDGPLVWEDGGNVALEDMPRHRIRRQRLAAHGVPHHSIR
jgi:hypothetical protein